MPSESDGHLRRISVGGCAPGPAEPSRFSPVAVVRTPTTRVPSTRSERTGKPVKTLTPSASARLAEPAHHLADRGDEVPVVLHRRRRGDAERAPPLQEVHGLGLDLAVQRHVLDGNGAPEEPAQATGVDDRSRHFVRSGLLAFLQYGDRHVAQAFRQLWPLLEELVQPDRAGQAGGPRTDDQDTDVDPLVRWVRGLSDELGRAERRRVLRWPDAHLRCSTS